MQENNKEIIKNNFYLDCIQPEIQCKQGDDGTAPGLPASAAGYDTELLGAKYGFHGAAAKWDFMTSISLMKLFGWVQ